MSTLEIVGVIIFPILITAGLVVWAATLIDLKSEDLALRAERLGIRLILFSVIAKALSSWYSAFASTESTNGSIFLKAALLLLIVIVGLDAFLKVPRQAEQGGQRIGSQPRETG